MAKRELFQPGAAPASSNEAILATPAKNTGEGDQPKPQPKKNAATLTKAASSKLASINTKASELRVLIKEVSGASEELTLGNIYSQTLYRDQ